MITVIAYFLVGFIIGSFIEYWAHRFMHFFPSQCMFHVRHHKENTAQGVLGEFRSYAVPAVLPVSLTFIFSWQLGTGLVLGMLAYAFFAAYAHQLQHDNPDRCFWMAMPVHYVHHKHNQWHYNFGIGVDCWDRLFGTYSPSQSLTLEKKKT
jgi:sterol desaturase/sphingolipid hydroxylase (fatty acid hydroxylase superfamily)